MKDMKVEWVELEKLIPYVNNPKEHPEEQVKKIASSIKNFGFRVPILIDEKNEIIAGHGRYLAAKLLGLEKVPVIRITDLTEAQKKAFRIADNKVAESGWDLDTLTAELEQLKELDFDLQLTGFDEDELNKLFATPDEDEILNEFSEENTVKLCFKIDSELAEQFLDKLLEINEDKDEAFRILVERWLDEDKNN